MRDDVREAVVQEFLREGFVVLRDYFPAAKLEAWRRSFLPLMAERIEKGTASPRGPGRYYVSLPFVKPWADEEIFLDPNILAIVETAAGGDIVMPELASDTPFDGSKYQNIHRDHPQRSPDLPHDDVSRPFQFALNFPLAPITAEDGPFEIVPRTHTLTDAETKLLVKSGEAENRIVPLLMNAGDVMIRDVRALHRGTPNRSGKPRVMIVVGYNRVEHLRPKLKIHVPKSTLSGLSPRAKELVRLNPVVDRLDDELFRETYSNLDFLDY